MKWLIILLLLSSCCGDCEEKCVDGKIYQKSPSDTIWRKNVAVAEKFDITWTPEAHAEVKRIDNAVLANEAFWLMRDPKDWVLPEPPISIKKLVVSPWSPEEAKIKFMERYHELAIQVGFIKGGH